jgi:hypothetical protein
MAAVAARVAGLSVAEDDAARLSDATQQLAAATVAGPFAARCGWHRRLVWSSGEGSAGLVFGAFLRHEIHK